MDLLRSLIAEALGLGRMSSLDTLGASSKLGALFRVGDVAGDESREVISVRCPEDIYENLLLSLKLSSCRPSWDVMLLVMDWLPDVGRIDEGCTTFEVELCWASSSLSFTHGGEAEARS